MACRIPFTGDPAFARPLDALGGSTALRPSVQTIDQTLRTPYVWEWFLGVQRQLPGDWMIEANYLGNAGRKLLIRQELNRYTGTGRMELSIVSIRASVRSFTASTRPALSMKGLPHKP